MTDGHGRGGAWSGGVPRGRPLRPVPERDVRPGGWIRAQLCADLDAGFVGQLDRLAPDLLVDDEIFGRDRLRRGMPQKDLGALSDDAAWEAQFQWWNAETQGNWRDGWLHHSLWAGGAGDRAAAQAWVGRILSTQDADGYLGIHAPELRFPEHGEHGELWAQAVLLRALLGYERHTGDERVVRAVRRAVHRTMQGYPLGASAPFGRDASFGGVTHGLMFTDVLWELAGRTGDTRYLDYAAWLYASFATSSAATGDARAADLLDPDVGFRGHGVHTYEHWRALTVAAVAASGGGASAGVGAGVASAMSAHVLDVAALDAAFGSKLAAALTPVGGPNGDETCHAHGSPDDTGYELCSVQELLHGYGLRVETTGEVGLGDRMESVLFNVAFGMRDPTAPRVAYLKTDNSRSMTGPLDLRPATGNGVPQTRYRYSPLHREAAVCCVPNWGRLLPTYLRYQWLLGRAGGQPQVVALLFGDGEVRTTVDDVPVAIRQSTTYPAETDVRFTIEAARPVGFSLGLRRPGWAGDVDIRGVAGERVHLEPSLVRIEGPWAARTTIEVAFRARSEVRALSGGRRVIARGPLLYALPLPGSREVVRTYPVADTAAVFADVLVRPGDTRPDPILPAAPAPRPAAVPPWSDAAGALHAWQRLGLAVDMVDDSGTRGERRLVPMGATLLRVVAFPSP